MAINPFEEMLTGGHPNSLGNTLEVVEIILNNKGLLDDLIACYRSDDAVVRLRVSNAVKRVTKEKPEWAAVYLDDFLGWISEINQASTKWTLSTLYVLLAAYMDTGQRNQAIQIMKKNLHYDDWIVQNTTAEALYHFAVDEPQLAQWLKPELKKMMSSRHKSVAKRSQKLLEKLL